MKKNLPLIIRILISALFLLSAIAKLYPTPMYGITKVFEEGQLIPMGFSESLAVYISRFIIAVEFFIAFAILQRHYLKKIIIPSSIFLLVLFSLHLFYSILLGDSSNCGCFGELIPMSPLEALIKNIITIAVLVFLYKKTKTNKHENFSRLGFLFLFILLLIFAFIPISKYSADDGNTFISYVEDNDFRDLDDEKILCFFDPGCDHCQDAAISLDSISKVINDFPPIYVVFSDTESDNIPNFFESVGREYPYQVMPFANYDTDEIDSYMEITFPDYDNPVIILYDGVRQVRLYEGTGRRAFSAHDLSRILVNK